MCKIVKNMNFGTWKSIFEDFDDLCTCINFDALRDVER